MMGLGMTLMMGFWFIVPLLFVGGVVVLALGFRPQINQTKPAQTNRTSLEILKARYARGEIGRDEFEQMLRDLEG